MEQPQIRPGKVPTDAVPATRVVAFFYNSAQGNAAIQLLTAYGLPNDRMGVTPPERLDTGQGMVISIACPDESMIPKVEELCRQQGAEIHRTRR